MLSYLLIILYKDVDTLESQDPAELLLPQAGSDELLGGDLPINILGDYDYDSPGKVVTNLVHLCKCTLGYHLFRSLRERSADDISVCE